MEITFLKIKSCPLKKEIKTNILGDLVIGQKRIYKQENVDQSERSTNLKNKLSNSSENKKRREFDTNGNLNLKEMSKFHMSVRKKIVQCSVCMEAWPRKEIPKDVSQFVCSRCLRDKGVPKKFSNENSMIPAVVPPELENLTQCEEMLIARAFPVMQVYIRPNSRTTGYRGHVVTLPHNVQHIVDILPRCPKDLPIISFAVKNADSSNRYFQVRRKVVLEALVWLKKYNPLYQNIIIDYDLLNDLPIDGTLDIKENIINDSEVISPDFGLNDASSDHCESSNFIPTVERQPTEKDRLSKTFEKENNCNYLDIEPTPFNEFSTPYLATLAFPTLFPDGKGDPTDNQQIRQISENQTECFATKLKHLVKFGEFKNGTWVYRFASHPRFGYWAYNMLQRKRLLLLGNFYIKQNYGESLPSIDELREMLHTNNYSSLMKKIQYYAKNISGSNSYWYQVKEQLKATLQQFGTPTIFWTLSCAELHWPEFHALFGEVNYDYNTYRNNVVNNPHILDWFFTERVEAFVKHWL